MLNLYIEKMKSEKSNKEYVCLVADLGFAKQVSTRVLFVDQKKILEDSTPNEIFNNPKTERLKEFLSKVLI